MREINVGQVTRASLEDIVSSAKKGSYTNTEITVLDCAGRPSDDNTLMPNGVIVIENAYTSVVLYCLHDGEIVRLVEDNGPEFAIE